MEEWEKMVEALKTPEHEVKIAIVGKYTELRDSYISIVESLKHGGITNSTSIDMRWINAEFLESQEDLEPLFRDVHGILIPGGFGIRGIEGKIRAIQYARENKIPYLGLCLGMQTAVIEFARNILHLENANSSEFDPDTKYPVIDLMQDQNSVVDKGGTMRLGAYPCKIKRDTKLYDVYKEDTIYERHRHRFEFNNKYKAQFEKAGLVFSGLYEKANLVEVIELPSHPFFMATQYHPEFKSRPNKPHPLFAEFVKASCKRLTEQAKLFEG